MAGQPDETSETVGTAPPSQEGAHLVRPYIQGGGVDNESTGQAAPGPSAAAGDSDPPGPQEQEADALWVGPAPHQAPIRAPWEIDNRLPVVPSVAAVEPPGEVRRTDARPPKSGGGRRRALLMGTGGLVLVGLGVVAVAALAPGGQDETAAPDSPMVSAPLASGGATGSPMPSATPTTAAPSSRATAAKAGAPPRPTPKKETTSAAPEPSVTRTAPTTHAAAPPPGNPDLALHAATSDDGHTQTYASGNAVDGDASSYWESTDSAFPQSLTVDLGATRTVGRLVLELPPLSVWETRTETLSVLAGTNGSSFHTVAGSAGHTFDPGSGNTVTIRLPSPATARYLRLTFTGNTAWPAGQVSELKAYGS